MTSLGLWFVLFLGFVTIERIYGGGVAPDVQLGSMEAPAFPERPVLFTSPSEVKHYLDSLGKKISFSSRQRYGKRAILQVLRDANSARLEQPSDSQDECNCERLRK
ncbi:unnamed protein product [Orchesella dallaii]|uniref:Uncharacterized protein n=1 Tax=Orchesella dallaii TaxID=48710 RepID=A0ABP1RKT1_9HEXA